MSEPDKRKNTARKPPVIPWQKITDFKDASEFYYFVCIGPIPTQCGTLFTPFEITNDINLIRHDLKTAGFEPGTKEYEEQVERMRRTFFERKI